MINFESVSSQNRNLAKYLHLRYINNSVLSCNHLYTRSVAAPFLSRREFTEVKENIDLAMMLLILKCERCVEVIFPYFGRT